MFCRAWRHVTLWGSGYTSGTLMKPVTFNSVVGRSNSTRICIYEFEFDKMAYFLLSYFVMCFARGEFHEVCDVVILKSAEPGGVVTWRIEGTSALVSHVTLFDLVFCSLVACWSCFSDECLCCKLLGGPSEQ